jgi:2,4-dienoyl-CoA reductase (NADPH2)
MVAQQDLGAAAQILHPKAVFRSPMAFTPYPGRRRCNLILGTVVQVFKDFTYHRTWSQRDGLSVVLEFSATVNGKELKGIDLIRFDEDGKIVDFEVMVRPMSGLQAWATRWPRLAPYLMKGCRPGLIKYHFDSCLRTHQRKRPKTLKS